MRLNTNINSLNIYKNYKNNMVDNSNALNKISSGKKILTAKDSPTKIGQTGEMRIKIKSLQMAEKNLQDTSSMLQSTEGSLNEISNSLVRMKELVVRGLTDTSNEGDKKVIQAEIDSIKSGIESLVDASSFNGVSLIDDSKVTNNQNPNSRPTISGFNKGEKIDIPSFNLNTNRIVDGKGNSLKELSIVDKGETALDTIDYAVSLVGNVRSKFGAIQSRVESTSEQISRINITNQEGLSRLEDADVAKEIIEFTRTSILHDAGIGLMAQSNNLPREALSILERIK